MVTALDTKEDLVLEQDGKPVMVVMTYQRYQELMDHIEDLEDNIAVYETRDDMEPTISLEEYIAQRNQ